MVSTIREPAGHVAGHEVDRPALGFFRRSTIRTRLTVAFLLLAVVLAMLGVVGVWQLQVLADAAVANPAPEAVRAAARAAQVLVGGVCAVVVVVGFSLGYPLTVAIVKPIRVAARIAKPSPCACAPAAATRRRS
jgi:hypothetical protein